MQLQRQSEIDPHEVARVYNRAKELGHPVTRAVALHFGIARMSATNEIAYARRHGLIATEKPTARCKCGTKLASDNNTGKCGPCTVRSRYPSVAAMYRERYGSMA